MRNRRPLLWAAVLGVLATIAGVAIVLAIDWFPVPASTAAGDIDTLYDVLLIVSVAIFMLVMTVAIYSVWAFRVKPGDTRDGAPIHGSTRLEILWVTVPLVIVSVLAGYGWIVLDDIEAKKADELVVEVSGQQFAWTFAYPELDGLQTNQLVLPVDRPVHFKIGTEDVLHSFWVPEFRLKSDAVPGITTTVRLTPNRLGSYPVVCAELCGIGHATMRQTVRVVSAADFDGWVDRQRASKVDGGVDDAGGDPVAAGRQLFTDSGCNACHTLADADATGSAGPSLDDLAAQADRLGGREGLTPAEYVENSIVDPNAIVVEWYQPDLMPTDYGDRLTPAQLKTLVDYLLAVGKGGDGQ